MKKMLVTLLSLSLLTACSSESEPTNTAPADTGSSVEAPVESQGTAAPAGGTYSYELQGNNIELGAEFTEICSKLGEPNDYFEAPSCAFEGLDKIYYYTGVEVRTFPEGDLDYVSHILLKDDTVTTDEGAYIGMAMEEVLEKHGEGYTQDGTLYAYKQGESTLTFIEEEGNVISITYSLDGIDEAE